MKKYYSYKDSGIEWIGEIPSHWDKTYLKYNMNRIYGGGTPSTSEEIYWSENDNDIPWVAISDISSCNKELYFTKKKITEEGRKSKNLDIIPKGTLLLSIFASLGKTVRLGIDATVNQAILGLEPNEKLHSKFLEFLLLDVERYISQFSTSSTQENLNLNKIKNLFFYLPNTIEEQTIIANYLDQKTTQIDDLIAKKERLIQLLEEERTAIINQAVTKGLDPTVPMKDSGIEWLGEIPAHWEVKKLKYFANVILGKMLTNEDKGGYQLKPYLRAKNIEWIKPNVDDVKEMWFSKNEISQYRIKENDLLVSEGGEVGRTCIWQNQLEECYIQNSVHKVTILDGDSNYFLSQFVLFGNYGHFDAIVNKISIAHLTKEKLKDVVFIVPPIDEQLKISKYITSKVTEIENIVSKTKQEIELLKEYKTALISKVVTGKVDVRNEKLS